MIIDFILTTMSVKINDTKFTERDIARARIDLEFGEPSMCQIALMGNATQFKVSNRANIVVSGTSSKQADGRSMSLFFEGLVEEARPYSPPGGQPVLGVLAFDFLNGLKLSTVPDPVEMLQYMPAPLDYITILAEYVVQKAVRRKLTILPEVRHVLEAIPGGSIKNAKVFEESLDKLARGMTKEEGLRFINEMRSRMHSIQEGNITKSMNWHKKYLGKNDLPSTGLIDRVYHYPDIPPWTEPIPYQDDEQLLIFLLAVNASVKQNDVH